MKAEEFIRAIANADFNDLIGERNDAFLVFLEEAEQDNRSSIVIRFLMEHPTEDEIPVPYYVWARYPVMASEDDGEISLYPPDFSDVSTYLRTPEEVEGEKFFEVAIP